MPPHFTPLPPPERSCSLCRPIPGVSIPENVHMLELERLKAVVADQQAELERLRKMHAAITGVDTTITGNQQ